MRVVDLEQIKLHRVLALGLLALHDGANDHEQRAVAVPVTGHDNIGHKL